MAARRAFARTWAEAQRHVGLASAAASAPPAWGVLKRTAIMQGHQLAGPLWLLGRLHSAGGGLGGRAERQSVRELSSGTSPGDGSGASTAANGLASGQRAGQRECQRLQRRFEPSLPAQASAARSPAELLPALQRLVDEGGAGAQKAAAELAARRLVQWLAGNREGAGFHLAGGSEAGVTELRALAAWLDGALQGAQAGLEPWSALALLQAGTQVRVLQQ
jgi:hypothetical protein